MTQTQPDALRIADLLEQYSLNSLLSPLMEVAAELRHQHARIAELRHQHARIAELEAQLAAIGAGGVEPLRKAAKPQADRLVALNSLTRYTVGRRGNGPMHTFAHPEGPYLRYTEVEAAMAAMKPRVWTAEKAEIPADDQYLMDAVLNCPHSITHDAITLHFYPKQKEGHNALAQLRHRLAAADAAAKARELELLAVIEDLEQLIPLINQGGTP